LRPIDGLHEPDADSRLDLRIAPPARPGAERLDQLLPRRVQLARGPVQPVDDDPLHRRVEPTSKARSRGGAGIDALDLAEAPRAHAELNRQEDDGGGEENDDVSHCRLRPSRSSGTIARAAKSAARPNPGRKLRVSGARTAVSSWSRAARTEGSFPAPASSNGFDRSGV